MTFSQLFCEDEFKQIFFEIENFTRPLLTEYNNYLESSILPDSGKEIFDAVWGNIEFSAGEVAILDSPLLQRLRKIKQLGLAYFVYCGCDYSRFYHTIGVIYLADRMCNTINKCDTGNTLERKAYFRRVVRLSALFHDVGHMFFSHVSEHYFGKSPAFARSQEIAAMLEAFERRTGKSTALHELLSCMIVNTVEVKRLLKNAVMQQGEDLLELVEYISCLIVGVPVDREVLPYSNVVNGPIDADKCDYLSRDSHVTKVPVAVDISRLTQKLSVVKVEKINKSDLWHVQDASNIAYYELAMTDSAEKALFQLCIARTIMFDSVYYHHKVLTAETQFRKILDRLSKLIPGIFYDFSEILRFTDEDFNDYFFESLKNRLLSKQNLHPTSDEDKMAIPEKLEELSLIADRIHRIYSRAFAKRVACISTVPANVLGTQSARENLFDCLLTSLDSNESVELIEIIKSEYLSICSLLGEPDNIKNADIFVIQSPNNIFGHGKIQVPIDMKNGDQRDFQGYELVNSRETSSSSSYIVTDIQNRFLVYLALEKVFYRQFHVRMSSSCSACAKLDKNKLLNYHTELFRKNYYNDVTELIKDELLTNVMPTNAIDNIVSKFALYEGRDGETITKERTKIFFKQLLGACQDKGQCNKLLDGVCKLLEETLFIDRKFIVDKTKLLLEQASQNSTTFSIFPLGNSLDSSAHMGYFFNDIKKTVSNINMEKDLEKFLSENRDETIIFYDDGCFSGHQVVSIFQEYMGLTGEKSTKEHHVDELSNAAKDKLKHHQIIFLFLAFNPENAKEICNELSKLGLNQVEILYEKCMSQKYLNKNSKLFGDEQREIVKKTLTEVGERLLTSTKKEKNHYKEGWSKERVKTSALGYNDAQQMVILKSSVPTYTITAFWQEGRFNENEWHPLFLRTIKEN